MLNALTYILRKLRFREKQFEICLKGLTTLNQLQLKKMRFLVLEASCFRISHGFRSNLQSDTSTYILRKLRFREKQFEICLKHYNYCAFEKQSLRLKLGFKRLVMQSFLCWNSGLCLKPLQVSALNQLRKQTRRF